MYLLGLCQQIRCVTPPLHPVKWPGFMDHTRQGMQAVQQPRHAIVCNAILTTYLRESSSLFKAGGFPSKTYLHSPNNVNDVRVITLKKLKMVLKGYQRLHWLHAHFQHLCSPEEHPLKMTASKHKCVETP